MLQQLKNKRRRLQLSNKHTQYSDINIPSAFLDATDIKAGRSAVEFSIAMDACILEHRARIGKEKFCEIFKKEFGFGSQDTIRRRATFLKQKNITVKGLHEFHKDIDNKRLPVRERNT
jgi:hypothetical protein